jgi:phosphatidylglycerol lysyltransferase
MGQPKRSAPVSSALHRLTQYLTPRILSILTFFAGLVLLFSGATPAAAGRLALLARVIPLGVIEASHFAGSVVGAGLLVLSHGLARRLDAAYFLTVGAIGIGIAASLLKGADYEEALLLTLLLLGLWKVRKAFDRRAAFFETRFSRNWIAAVAAALITSLWLGFFAFRHIEYSHELWWQFELYGEASRSLRASVGASIGLLMFAFARLIRQTPHETVPPSDAALADVEPVIALQTSVFPYLVYLRDKTVLFDDDKKGFVMYGVHGRTWVALGDPDDPSERTSDLIRLFIERCDDFGEHTGLLSGPQRKPALLRGLWADIHQAG